MRTGNYIHYLAMWMQVNGSECIHYHYCDGKSTCMCVYVLNHFAAHLRLMQCCKWMTLKFKKKMNKEKNALLSLSTLHHLNQLEATGQGAHWFGLHKAPPVTQQGRQRKESVWGTNRRQSAHVLEGFALKFSWRGNLRHWQLKYQWGMETLEC